MNLTLRNEHPMTAKPVEAGLYAAGQPTREDLAMLAGSGVCTVINLRASGEAIGFDESAEAEKLGLGYVCVPVAGANDLTRCKVDEFGRALDAARKRGAVLVHCATSNRVGAMVALDEALNRGRPLAAALERGRAAGLVSLEPAVVAVVQGVRTGLG